MGILAQISFAKSCKGLQFQASVRTKSLAEV